MTLIKRMWALAARKDTEDVFARHYVGPDFVRDVQRINGLLS